MQDNRTLLAFDTTGKGTSLCLFSQGRFYDHTLPDGGSQLQSSQLVPALLAICEQAECSLNDVTTLLTLAGPGSFTGIRLGLATAIGLKIALKCKTFAPSSLHVMAFKAIKNKPDSPCLALIDTLREDFYGLLMSADLQEMDPVQIYTMEHIQELQTRYPALTTVSNIPTPHSQEISLSAKDLIHYYIEVSHGSDWSELTPFYIRTPEFVKQKRYQNEPA